MHVIFYAPFVYSGHRYASTFQSAEALAHSLFGAKQKTRRQHRDRVEAVTKALEAAHLDEDNRKWAEAVLQSRNDKPLRELIEELITAADVMGAQLLQAAPGLAGEAATARAGVSHPGTKGPGIVRRYWLGEAILWLVRASVLAQLGIPMKDLAAKATQKASFINVVNWLKAEYTAMQAEAATRVDYRPGQAWVDNCIWGTPDQCIAKIQKLVDNFHPDEFMLTGRYGSMPQDQSQRSLELFAREVVPAVHEMPTLEPITYTAPATA
jgi:hypothetical protein